MGNTIGINCHKPELIKNLSEQFIIDISCGHRHSLVLSLDGCVYAFGSNYYGQCGNNSSVDQFNPIKVKIMNTTKVIAICCGDYHSVALTESGHVFGWGDNGKRQLGIDSLVKQQIAKQLTVPLIKQIMCGYWYTMMLTSKGDIYFCGTNNGCLSHSISTKINSSTKFIKIAATIHCELCVALSQSNKCFIFGKYGDKDCEVTIKYLRETDFVSLKETFANYQQITYKSIGNI